MPTVASIGYLISPTDREAATRSKEAEAASHVLGIRLTILNASSPSDIEGAFAKIREQRLGGLLVDGDPLFTEQLAQLAALTISMQCRRYTSYANLSMPAVS